MIAFLFIAAGIAAASPPALTAKAGECRANSPDEVLVCGRPTQRYRIDPSVLRAEREHDAAPPKPPAIADAAPGSGCVGGQGQGCTGAGVVPLVGVALAAAKAAVCSRHGRLRLKVRNSLEVDSTSTVVNAGQ